jgi:hypothetical protein
MVHRRPRLLYVFLRLTPGQPLSMRDDYVFGFVYGPRGIWDGGEEGLGGVVFGGVGLAGDREPISGLVFWSLAKSNAEKTLLLSLFGTLSPLAMRFNPARTSGWMPTNHRRLSNKQVYLTLAIQSQIERFIPTECHRKCPKERRADPASARPSALGVSPRLLSHWTTQQYTFGTFIRTFNRAARHHQNLLMRSLFPTSSTRSCPQRSSVVPIIFMNKQRPCESTTR